MKAIYEKPELEKISFKPEDSITGGFDPNVGDPSLDGNPGGSMGFGEW